MHEAGYDFHFISLLLNCQRGGGETGWKKGTGSAKGHRQQCGDGQREPETGAGWLWAKGAEMRTSFIVSTIKKKKKKICKKFTT